MANVKKDNKKKKEEEDVAENDELDMKDLDKASGGVGGPGAGKKGFIKPPDAHHKK